jgi:hypothetical protein
VKLVLNLGSSPPFFTIFRRLPRKAFPSPFQYDGWSENTPFFHDVFCNGKGKACQEIFGTARKVCGIGNAIKRQGANVDA